MKRRTEFVPVHESLDSLLGREYTEAVIAARSALAATDAAGRNPRRAHAGRSALRLRARTEVDLFPASFYQAQLQLLSRVGEQVAPGLAASPAGASTQPFNEATHREMAPLAGLGCFRVGEDGRLYLASKSEHYHAPLGHGFPGYRLLEIARGLGIPNATHNNTRGYITRLLEERLIRAANGVPAGESLAPVLSSDAPGALNRVLNLETGSLACEAALKMMLARFYQPEPGCPEPPWAGRTPVFLVLGDDRGTSDANYHGTTVVAQMLRGLWPALYGMMEKAGLLRVAPVRPNRIEDVREAFARFEQPPFKVAGFLHELVMMNYGVRLLDPGYIREVYSLCRAHDVPVLCDEIQSCVWSPQLFLFREYGLAPDFVAVGKGLPGGEYAASRILFGARYDSLRQFGALVTNGQEEIASLAYLVTMRWAEANAEVTAGVGEYLESRLREMVEAHPRVLRSFEGRRHLAGLCFHDLETCAHCAKAVAARGFDISAQTYKPNCPPVALTKLPLIAGYEMVDALVGNLEEAVRVV